MRGLVGVIVTGATTSSAVALLREIELLRPDMVVVDIRMPPTHTDEGLGPRWRSASGGPASGCSSCPST
ncbi:hypothetical protein STENM327S_06224 [Streptomyces tendae]